MLDFNLAERQTLEPPSLAAAPPRHRMSAESIAAALGHHTRKAGGGFMACCPAHEDKNPSLAIDENNGALLVKCFAGCEQGDVIAALKSRGLWSGNTDALPALRKAPISQTWRPVLPIPIDSPPPPAEHYQLGRPSAVWFYKSRDGELLQLVYRFDTAKGKEIRPLSYHTDGNAFEWRWQALPEPRPLYGLHRIGDHKHVVLCEGEKAADAAQRLLAQPCLTWPGGCNAVEKADWAPLRGLSVEIWPDADEPGMKAALAVAEKLARIGAVSVKIAELSADLPRGWDAADAEAEGWTAEQARRLLSDATVMNLDPLREKSVQDTPEHFSLDLFSINEDAESMEQQMLEDKFVLGRLAIMGQSTVLFARFNSGKTLLTLWMLMEAIRQGEINGADVYYVNADDTFEGLVAKGKIAKRYGFHMLAPGHRGFKAEDLPAYLAKLIEAGSAKGKVLILDTAKKFTNLMRKDLASKFGESIRQFVSHGGTVVMLAHVNKHRGDDGKVIFSGTSDLVDDADCAYTLDVVTEDAQTRTVKFENLKSRGAVAKQATYRYNSAEGTKYGDRLLSVVEVGNDELKAAERQSRLDATLERNRAAVEAIVDCIRDGITQKTTLIDAAHERSNHLSKRQITKALSDHTGANVSENQFWHVSVADKNAHVYQLNYGVF